VISEKRHRVQTTHHDVSFSRAVARVRRKASGKPRSKSVATSEYSPTVSRITSPASPWRCTDEAIAAIVALAADNHNAMSRCVTRHNVIRDSGTGVLHQRRRRDAELLAAGAVNGAHFFCGNDLHDWEGGAAVKPAAP